MKFSLGGTVKAGFGSLNACSADISGCHRRHLLTLGRPRAPLACSRHPAGDLHALPNTTQRFKSRFSSPASPALHVAPAGRRGRTRQYPSPWSPIAIASRTCAAHLQAQLQAGRLSYVQSRSARRKCCRTGKMFYSRQTRVCYADATNDTASMHECSDLADHTTSH